MGVFLLTRNHKPTATVATSAPLTVDIPPTPEATLVPTAVPVAPTTTPDPHPTLTPTKCEDPVGETWVMVAVRKQGCGIFVREVGSTQGCQFSWSKRENPCLGKTIDVFVNDIPFPGWKGYYLNLFQTTASPRSWWLATNKVNRLTLPEEGIVGFGAYAPKGVKSIDAANVSP